MTAKFRNQFVFLLLVQTSTSVPKVKRKGNSPSDLRKRDRERERPRIFWTPVSLFILNDMNKSRKYGFTGILASLESKHDPLCKNSRIMHPNQRTIVLTNNE
jgi:hypothetical protein